MRICYLLLAHQHPALLARLIERLLDGGGDVCLHFDRKAGDAPLLELRRLLGERFGRLILAESVEVTWGQWSIVDATLKGLEAIRAAGLSPDYVYLLSGADYPIRPIADLAAYLERHRGTEFIESVDAETTQWVAAGIQRERYRYWFPFNWQKHERLVNATLLLQRLLRIERPFPDGLTPRIGSQWWVLTWATCVAILERVRDPALVRFFRYTCVPDELFFQTMVWALVPRERIDSRHLTLYQFTGYGVPVVYGHGHEQYLSRQPFFFARKLSPVADGLRASLDRVVVGEVPARDFPDAKIGRVNEEFRCFQLTRRKALPGRRVIGWAEDGTLRGLQWNARPYFAVVAESAELLAALRGELDGRDGIGCHGQLFDPAAIELAGDAVGLAGYRRDDTAIRDHSPQDFLADVLAHTGGELPGFVVQSELGAPGERRSRFGAIDIVRVIGRDPNATLFVLLRDAGDIVSDPAHEAFASAGTAAQQPARAGPEAGQQLFAAIYREQMAYLASLRGGARLFVLRIGDGRGADGAAALASRIRSLLPPGAEAVNPQGAAVGGRCDVLDAARRALERTVLGEAAAHERDGVLYLPPDPLLIAPVARSDR
jgi:hypothetical protein